jgi:hypothetical protein
MKEEATEVESTNEPTLQKETSKSSSQEIEEEHAIKSTCETGSEISWKQTPIADCQPQEFSEDCIRKESIEASEVIQEETIQESTLTELAEVSQHEQSENSQESQAVSLSEEKTVAP